MIQTKPSLILNRLLLIKGEKYVYNEKFHKGVNIIRSKGNSTGKTTIMDAIFFVLGGDIDEWTDEALACDFIIAEISFSGKLVTLKREIGDNRYPAIYIYEGSYNEAIKSALNWMKFSNRRSNERESYSQAIFRLLGYPEKQLSSFANITINEILRLVYSDQLTAVNKIFKHQNFDSEEMRQTVGEFLLGVDDLDLHGLRLQMRNEEKELSNVVGRIKTFQDILVSGGLNPDKNQIKKEIDQCLKKIGELKNRVSYLESQSMKDKRVEEPEEALRMKEKLIQTKISLRNCNDKREALIYEIEDSKLFVSSLNERKKALAESEVTRESLGDLKFEFCPACLTKLDSSVSTDENFCHLCKVKNFDEKNSTGFLRMQFEVEYQMRESEQLLNKKTNDLKNIDRKISELDMSCKLLQERYNSFIQIANPITAEIKEILTKIGQYEKTIENLIEKQKFADILSDLFQKKSQIHSKISQIEDEIKLKERNRKKRLQSLQKKISQLTIKILQDDVPSEETFAKATEFEFDFGKNRLFVDGRSKFSASSVCYLKTAFLFAIYLISLEDSNVLFPRFSLMDNIEDKGSTPERVQNMHKILIEHLNNTDQDHQLIFTTSVLSEELNNSDYCVGPEYNFNLKTLDL